MLAAAQDASEGVWSEILAAVTGSKAVSARTAVVCASETQTAAAVAAALAQDSQQLPEDVPDMNGGPPLGLAYAYADVVDDEGETAARIGIVQLSGGSAFHGLADMALQPSANPSERLVLVALDWAQPAQMLQNLNEWLFVLERHAAASAAAHPDAAASARRVLEALVANYCEPDEGGSGCPPRNLPHGVLSRNIGIPFIVVCWNSEMIPSHEKDLKEERIDYIQQALRCICMSYGAALIYASEKHPNSISNLRCYVLHRLLSPAQTSIALNAISQQSTPQQTTNSNKVARHSPQSLTGNSSFEFHVKPQVVDRETVLVPAGWDTIGKIRALREEFPCNVYANISTNFDPISVANEDEISHAGPLANMLDAFAREIPDHNCMPFETEQLVEPEDEQLFLSKHAKFLQSIDRQGDTAYASRLDSSDVVAAVGSPVAANTIPAEMDESEPNLNSIHALESAQSPGYTELLSNQISESPESSPHASTTLLTKPGIASATATSPKRKPPPTLRDAKSQLASSKDALQEMRSKILSHREQTAALREKSRSTVALSGSTTKRVYERSGSMHTSNANISGGKSQLVAAGSSTNVGSMVGVAGASANSGAAGGSNQNEVLAMFFQNLLTKKKPSSAGSSSSTSTNAHGAAARAVSPLAASTLQRRASDSLSGSINESSPATHSSMANSTMNLSTPPQPTRHESNVKS